MAANIVFIFFLLPLSLFSQFFCDSLDVNNYYLVAIKNLEGDFVWVDTRGIMTELQQPAPDVLGLLPAFGADAPSIDFCDMIIGDSFGEGNTMLGSLDAAVDFFWLHRTPADEAYNGNYLGFNLVSFVIDRVANPILFYYYERK